MKRSLLICQAIVTSVASFAGHLPGGNITYACTGPDEYTVTLTLFRDCGGAALLPQALTFTSDCGSSYTLNALPVGGGTEVSQLCPADLPNSSCNGGPLPGIEVYTVAATAFMGACDGWTISWHECCRTASLNVDGNPETYIEARLNSATAPCNNSPVFTQDVIPYVCVNQPVNYNLGVTEPDGDVLRYRLIDARGYSGGPVPVVYQAGYSGAEPWTGMAIDSLTGQIAFTPTLLGNIFTVVRVEEYNANGDLVGSVMRDFPFVVINCPNNAPDPAAGELVNVSGALTSTANSAEMCRNGTLCFDLIFTDADSTQTLTVTTNIGSVLPEATVQVNGNNPSTASVCFTPDSTDAGIYPFLVTVEDDGCPNTALTTYPYTVTILSDTSANCTSTGIVTMATSDILLAPQPSTGELTVQGNALHAGNRIEVYDALGSLRWTHTLPAEQPATIVLPRSLADGRYFLRVAGRDGSLIVRPFTLLR